MDFPKPISSKLFLVLIICLFILFCINPEYNPIDFRLFKNDFSEPDTLSWLISQLIAEIFIFLLSWQACANISDRLLKSIYYAVMIDSLVTALFAILFGYSPSIWIMGIRNLFTIMAMYYAYYVLHKRK